MSGVGEFVKRLYKVGDWRRKKKPVDARDLYPGLVAAGVVAEKEVVTNVDPPSRSRKKKTQIGAKVFRTYRKSKPAHWMDVETKLKKHRAKRTKRVKREKESRRRNGWRRSAQ